MNPFFSIVVPCCDVEPYIEECLQSVLKQSFQDWECLIGIETSKDKTEEIIRKITAGDPRFRIFTGPRSGSCSVPRNIGIDNAQGEYIIFLDGDDSIADGALERLHERICANPGADLYPCKVVTNHDEIWDNYKHGSPREMTGIEATLYLEHDRHAVYMPNLQLTVHRREFLVENGLKCIPGLRCEDCEFSPRALYLAKRVVPLHEPFYLYRYRPHSILRAAKDADYFVKDWAILTKSLLMFYDRVSREDGFDTRVASYWVRQWISRMNYRYFTPEAQSQIPREKRAEWLKFFFEDTSDIYDRLTKCGSFSQRVSAFFVRMFTKHPSMRWASELFFRVYYSMLLSNVKKQNFQRK